jgi:pimeloyl-ACP methyl ester carboxylesterase
MIFIAAFPLDDGESCTQAATEASAAAGIHWEGRPNLGDGFVIPADGSVTLDPDVAARCLYNDCDDATVKWALDRLGPHPFGNLKQSPLRLGWKSTPSTYVVCADDLGVHPDLQRILANRCSSVVEWPTGHSPFLSDPQRVVELIVEAARHA